MNVDREWVRGWHRRMAVAPRKPRRGFVACERCEDAHERGTVAWVLLDLPGGGSLAAPCSCAGGHVQQVRWLLGGVERHEQRKPLRCVAYYERSPRGICEEHCGVDRKRACIDPPTDAETIREMARTVGAIRR